jgi:hypothetical protein
MPESGKPDSSRLDSSGRGALNVDSHRLNALKEGWQKLNALKRDPLRRSALRVLLLAALCACPLMGAAEDALPEPIKHGQPELVVDLGVGLWALPLPMDYDGDGDFDMLVSTSNKPSAGLYLFENTTGPDRYPIFAPARRVGDAQNNCTICYEEGEPRVLTPGKVYPDFRSTGFAKPKSLPLKVKFHTGRANQWTYCDYDGDGREDLVIGTSDWREYGWDNAYDAFGNWTNGPIHGYVYVARNVSDSAEPKYETPRQLQVGTQPLDVFGCPSPNFADFDADGDLDLVCGSFLDTLTYFENVGTRTQPAYARGRTLESAAGPITMELQMLRVVAFDWDRDGDTDLIVGQEDGRVALVENSGQVVDRLPRFLEPRFFQQRAGEVKCGALVTPCSVDFDGDGDEDLICGDTAGYLSWIENLGGGATPRWSAPRRLTADGQVIRVQAGYNGSIQGPAEAKWGYTVPAVGDWDGDGLPDVMINSIWGEILWYRNCGTREEPQLAAAQRVEVDWKSDPTAPAWNWWSPCGNQLVTQWRTSPCLYDLDQDGLQDLIMLDQEGYLAFYQRKRQGDRLTLLPPQRVFEDHEGRPLRLNDREAGKSGRRKLTLADWDSDGKIDILINGRSIDFLRNVTDASTAEKGHVRFQEMGPVTKRILAGHTTCPTTVDWDSNGVPDLLIGGEDGWLYYLANPHEAPSATASKR